MITAVFLHYVFPWLQIYTCSIGIDLWILYSLQNTRTLQKFYQNQFLETILFNLVI